MKKKKELTAEEIAEDNQRTTARGMFLTAEAYWEAAQAVDNANLKAGRRDSPIRFLFYHALELYLKAYLRGHDVTVPELTAMGHRYKQLMDRATGFGLKLDAEDVEVLTSLGAGDAWIRSRYIRTGIVRVGWYANSTLNSSCGRIDKAVSEGLQKHGIATKPSPSAGGTTP